jgi:hypothetical protein
VEAPPRAADRGFYSTYFSQGVLLEARLFAGAIAGKAAAAVRPRVVQVYISGDSGEVAAQALDAELAREGMSSVHHTLAREAGPEARLESLGSALRGLDDAGTVVLWLRPQELQALSRWPAPKATVLVSGLLGGFERAPLPAAWRENAVMAQAVDLPDRRRARVDYALGWFRLRRVALVAPQVQADTYLACGLLSEVLNHSADVAVREYVLERFEDMIERRVLTGYYPRLSLGPGQRFASKGGFLVRFAGSEGQKLVADGAWTVP